MTSQIANGTGYERKKPYGVSSHRKRHIGGGNVHTHTGACGVHYTNEAEEEEEKEISRGPSRIDGQWTTDERERDVETHQTVYWRAAAESVQTTTFARRAHYIYTRTHSTTAHTLLVARSHRARLLFSYLYYARQLSARRARAGAAAHTRANDELLHTTCCTATLYTHEMQRSYTFCEYYIRREIESKYKHMPLRTFDCTVRTRDFLCTLHAAGSSDLLDEF
uniref:Uncharacterized protein n=1 Tax=Trichogramma kaykai TaxID=54128 RepID=A0ABD2XAV0_9HYME